MQMANQSIASDMFGVFGSMHVPQEEHAHKYNFSASETKSTQTEKNENMRVSNLDLAVQTNNLTTQLKTEGHKIWAAGGVLEQPGQLSVSKQKAKKGARNVAYVGLLAYHVQGLGSIIRTEKKVNIYVVCVYMHR